MVLDREEFGFGMEVAEGGHLEGAKAGSEGKVLDTLEFEDVGGGGVGEPDGRGVGEDGTDEGFVGKEHCFFLVTPGRTSQSF